MEGHDVYTHGIGLDTPQDRLRIVVEMEVVGVGFCSRNLCVELLEEVVAKGHKRPAVIRVDVSRGDHRVGEADGLAFVGTSLPDTKVADRVDVNVDGGEGSVMVRAVTGFSRGVGPLLDRDSSDGFHEAVVFIELF